ncbi:MAG: CHAT domain-containing protein [Cyanobacteria bacterium J06639_16]
MAQEFHISITTVGEAKYLIRTEQVEPGVPLAETQLIWDVETWLEQAQRLMHGPLARLLQGSSKSSGLRSPTDFSESDLAPELLDPSVMTLGKQLYDALFQDLIRDSWVTAQGVAQNRRQLLRLRLGIKDHRLQHLPWEVMNSGDRSPIATGTDLTFCRYHPNLLTPLRAVASSQKQAHQLIRVLMVVAGPDDQERLALSREVRQLQQELGRSDQSQRRPNAIANAVPIQVTLLEQPGRTELTQTLEQGHFHVLHYAGHSNLGETGGDLYLVSRQTGLTERLSGDDLAGLLVNNGTQLAIFNSCRSAYATAADIAGWREQNLAQALVNRGVPGVIAMAERIPDEIAITFTQLFYRNLKAGYTIDLSLNRARQALLSVKGSDQVYWALPVLYMQPGFNGYLGESDPASDLLHSLLEDDGDELWSDEAEVSDSIPSVVVARPNQLDDRDLPSLGGLDEGDDDFWDDDEEIDLDAIADTLDATADEEYAEDSAFVGSIMQQLANPATAAALASAPPGDSLQSDSLRNEALQSDSVTSRSISSYAQPTSSPDRAVGDPAMTGSQATLQTSDLPRPSVSRVSQQSTFVEPDFSTPHPRSTPNFTRLLRRFSLGNSAQPWLWLALGMVAVGSVVGVSRLNRPKQTELFPAPVQSGGGLAEAVLALKRDDLVAATNTIESLLDSDQLSIAQEALDAASPRQLTNPEILYLRGRLQWQQGQKDNLDFDLNDVLRSWQQAVADTRKTKETLTARVNYNTALGFAYYAQGDFPAAVDTWKEVIRLNNERYRQLAPDGSDEDFAVQELPFDAYAGLAIALYNMAQTTPDPNQSDFIRDARKSYCLVVTSDPSRFGTASGLSGDSNWLWGPAQIKDWQTIGPKLASCQ